MNWPTHYACAPDLTASDGRYRVRPIAWEDREAIRTWRNAQIDVLRQTQPLTPEAQAQYFSSVVAPQMRAAEPEQILLALTFDAQLIGYGGPVHIAWSDRRSELSFLTRPDRRMDAATLRDDWTAFLGMLQPICRDQLRLHKLTTEVFESRADLLDLLESSGFEREGMLREHHWWDGRWVTSVVHGLILDRG